MAIEPMIRRTRLMLAEGATTGEGVVRSACGNSMRAQRLAEAGLRSAANNVGARLFAALPRQREGCSCSRP